MAQRGGKARDYCKLIAEYKSRKYKPAELAERHGITVPHVYQVLKRNGVKTHSKKHTIDQLDQKSVIHDYTSTSTAVKEINKKYGLSPGVLYKILEHNGIAVRRRGAPISPEMEERISSLFSNGLGIHEIADRTNVGVGVVRDSLIRNGIYKPKNFDDVEAEWKNLYESGALLYEIADKYGVVTATVRDHLLRQGVELRDFRRQKRRGRIAL